MTAPQGVRILRADGTVIECELIDDGVDERGMHNWIMAGVTYQPGDRVSCDVLPAKTSLTFRMGL